MRGDMERIRDGCFCRCTETNSQGFSCMQEEYVDAVLASSCAVGIAGWPYHTKKYGWSVDGGFTDVALIRAILLGTKFCKFHNGPVTSVCPFYWSRADIRPSRFVNPLWAIFPPPREKLMALYKYASSQPVSKHVVCTVGCCILDCMQPSVAARAPRKRARLYHLSTLPCWTIQARLRSYIASASTLMQNGIR